MGLRLLSSFFLSCFLIVSSAHAGIATYTLSGGTIDGTLNGVSFTGATYTLTADADPSNFVLGTVFTVPVLSQPAISTMTINGFTPFQITIANFGPFLADASSLFGAGTGYGGFGYSPDASNMKGIGVLGLLSSLSSNSTVTGALDATTAEIFTTTAGDLIFTSVSGIATFSGEFPSSAVPEPTSIAIFGLGALGMAYRARRKSKA
jgi:hypothetical protein